jgi:hypothetical protein
MGGGKEKKDTFRSNWGRHFFEPLLTLEAGQRESESEPEPGQARVRPNACFEWARARDRALDWACLRFGLAHRIVEEKKKRVWVTMST